MQRTENSGNEEFCTIKSATIKSESVDIRFDTIGPPPIPSYPDPRVSPRAYDKGLAKGTYGGAVSLIVFPVPLHI